MDSARDAEEYSYVTMTHMVFKKIRQFFPHIGYVAVVAAVFGNALLPRADQLIFGDDIHLTYYFFKKFFAQSVWQGAIPWWNPYNFAGQPMMAHPQAILAFYPLNWLFVVLPVNIAMSWYLALHIFWAMAGMYVLLRNVSSFKFQVSSLSGWVGGVIFGLSGFFMARVWAGHLDMIAAASWLPWVFTAFWRAMSEGKPRVIVLAGALLAIQLVAGYQTMALFTVEAIAVVCVVFVIATRSLRPFLFMIASVILAIGIAAVQLVPEQEFVSRSIRTFPLPYTWTSGYSMTTKMLRTMISPFLFGDQHTYTGQWPNFAEYAMYVGIVPLGLSLAFFIFMLAPKKSRTFVAIFGLIAIFSLWISLGPNAPIDLLSLVWRVVPLYHAVRLPSRHLVLLVFSLSVFAGIGVGYIRHKMLQWIVATIILIELIPFGRHFIELRPIPESHHDSELVKILQSDKALVRMLPNFGVWLTEREKLDFDSSLTYKIFSATGYDPSILRNYYEFVDAASGHETSSVLEHNVQVPYLPIPSDGTKFLSIKYILTPQEGNLKLSTMDNRDVLPRFFMVSEAIMVEDMQKAIRQHSYDLARVVLFDKQNSKNIPSLPTCQSREQSRVVVDSYTPNRIELSVSSPCDGFLVSSEVFYPGWEAYVDGEKTRIIEGNMAFRTLFVDSGKHTVVYRFFPYSFIVGGAISFITILVCFVLVRKRHTTHE